MKYITKTLAKSIFVSTLFFIGCYSIKAQCVPIPNSISGISFLDEDYDGKHSVEEKLQSNILVSVYDRYGQFAGSSVTDEEGFYSVSDLIEGEKYQVVFEHNTEKESSFLDNGSGSSVQYVTAPSCEVTFGLVERSSECGNNPAVAGICFVQGSIESFPDVETIIGLESKFNNNSAVVKYASQKETGSVWGLTFRHKSNELISSAFVKQSAYLKDGPYALYKTDISGTPTTSKFADINDLLNGKYSGLTETDQESCRYGDQVGRIGLGNLVISTDQSRLFVSVLDNNTVVSLDAENPTTEDTKEFQVPRPKDLDADAEYRVFALTYHENKLYVGATVTAAASRKEKDSRAVVYEMDPKSGQTEEIFSTNYIKGFWQDDIPDAHSYGQWLTDLDFTDEGMLLLSLSDRLGHRYCKESTGNRLDQQFPDLLAVWYDEDIQEWKLESNGRAGDYTGEGINNGQGPDGGEFFAHEFWLSNAEYHSETALGSVAVIPGSGEVIVSVYDPLYNSYSGGYHRYSTSDGKILGVKELYTNDVNQLFGKATGLGDIASLCGGEKGIEIGNYAWIDSNGDGIQQGGEHPISGLPLNIYSESCELIGTTTTDENGSYSFNHNNVSAGVYPNTTYYIEIDKSIYNEEADTYIYNNIQYTICEAGLGENTALDCDILEEEEICSLSSYIEVNTNSTNHNFDIGLAPSGGYDLALMKTIVGNKFAIAGQTTTFQISIYNQGEQTVSSVEIVDYLPTGYIFEEENNLGWTEEGSFLKNIIDEPIEPDTHKDIYLSLTATAGVGLEYTNIAEIAAAKDLNDEEIEDEDSTADTIKDNDLGSEANSETDDQINDDGSIDEDDQDPALPYIFDLALKVQLNEVKTYSPGDKVKFDVTVYNQGNIAADEYHIIQYADESLIFQEANSDGWVLSEDDPTLSIKDNLLPGEERTFCIEYLIDPESKEDSYDSYSEITYSVPVGSSDSFDFDSTPDNDDENDAGGVKNTSVDNFLQGNGTDDEDDHDVVSVSSRYYDLALRKYADVSFIKPGEILSFNFEVRNEGTLPVDRVIIIDYLPDGLELIDPAWVMNSPTTAMLTIDMDDDLEVGESIYVKIETRVKEQVPPGAMYNHSEIYKIFIDGEDVSLKDVDSSPNNYTEEGREGGLFADHTNPATRDFEEDDESCTFVNVITSARAETGCLNNATLSSDGSYYDKYSISSPSGEEWYISIQNNYTYTESIDPVVQLPIVTGPGNTLLNETVGDDGYSTYEIYLIREEGDATSVSFRNINDVVFSFDNAAETYHQTIIDGNIALCEGVEEEYSIIDPLEGVDYTWSLTGEGTIVGSNTGTSVVVDWSGVTRPAYHELTVTPSGSDECISPGRISVALGAGSGAMFCIGNMNLSLDADCEVTVTPNMVLSGGMPANTAYVVMLTDHQGEAIPTATLTSEHIGTTVTAKVIDGCSGNSCWSFIFVEDKVKPTINCVDDEIFCNKVDLYPGPFAEDNCGGTVIIEMLQNQFSKINDCEQDFIGEYSRSYQAVDAQGNRSEICDITVKVKRVDLADVVFPLDTEVSCNNFETDEDGNPAPMMTGRPIYKDEFLWPNTVETGACDIVTTYEDILLPNDGTTLGGVVKVNRTWKVYEWCSPELSVEHTQLIKIRDLEPPIITSCPQDITVSATGENCEATFSLPLPEAYDSCVGTNIVITTEYNGFTVLDNESRVVTLPYSPTPYIITYTVSDQTGLSTSCSSEISVVDDVAPLVVCDEHTAIGLNDNGVGYVYASMLDDGSIDACGISHMEVRRMDATGICGNANDEFADRVFFCCEDVGRENMVQLQVWDNAGNSNSCMVIVEVQDKAKPEIETLDDVVVQCGEDLFPLSRFGTPATNDACNVDLIQDSTVMLSGCGTGHIIRTFTATDGTNEVTSTQTISIINSHPFDPNTDITFVPEDYTIDGVCDMNQLHPDSLPDPYGRPRYVTDICDRVGIAHEDVLYPTSITDNTCFKIVRTYTITDWCQEDDESYEETQINQIITVTNNIAPSVTSEDKRIFYSDDCDEGNISLTAIGSDDCSKGEALSWSASIDYYQDGIATATFDVAPVVGTDSVAMISGRHPIGTHYVQWSFTDACGNTGTILREFTIANTIAPVFPCVNLSVGLTAMDLDNDGDFDTEMACFNIDTLLNIIPVESIYHPCGTDFELSLVSDSIVKKDTFDCSNIGINVITGYAIDIYGNVSECTFEIDVQDNNDEEVCIDVKSCVTAPLNGTIPANNDCEGIESSGIFDVQEIPDNLCGPLTITHNYNVDGDPGYTGTNDNTTLVGAAFPEGETVVTWFISTGTTVMGQCTVTISVVDETAPSFANCDITIEYNDNADLNVDCSHTNSDNIDPQAIDNCDESPLLTHNYNVAGDANYSGTNDNTTLVGAVFPIGTTIVQWTAIDADSNTSSCIVTVVVEDMNNPVLTCNDDDFEFDDLDDDTEDCQYTIQDNIVFFGDDVCDGSLVATHNYVSAPNNTDLIGAVFPIGTTNVEFTVTDSNGNTATCDIDIVVEDSTPPTLNCGQDIMASADSTPNPNTDCGFTMNAVTADPISFDVCGISSVVHDYNVFGNLGYTGTNDNTTLNGAVFPIGETVVTWVATDATGLTSTCQITINVEDNTPAECVDQDTAFINIGLEGFYLPSILDLSTPLVDNCDGTNLTYTFVPDSLFCEMTGDTLIAEFTTEDSSNNVSEVCEVVIVINENETPQCSPIDITVNLDQNGEAFITHEQINNLGSSSCGEIPVVTISKSVFRCNDIGDNQDTITVTVSGVTTECVAMVTVIDTLHGPEIECADNQTIDCEILNSQYGGSIQAWMDDSNGINNIADNCPPNPENMYQVDTSYVFTPHVCGFGQSTRTFVVTDENGLTSQCTQLFTVTGPEDLVTQIEVDALIPASVTITDCIDPTTVLPGTHGTGNITVTMIENLGDCVNGSVTFKDDIDLGPHGGMCSSTITRVWTIADLCQENAVFTFTQTITVMDVTGPVLLDGNDVIAFTSAENNCETFVSFTGLTFDDCNPVTYTNPEGIYGVGEHNIEITSMDTCGNVGLDTLLLTVRDTSEINLNCQKQFPVIMNDANPMASTIASQYVLVDSENSCSGDTPRILFSFSSTDINDTIRLFDCDDVQVLQEYYIYFYSLDGELMDSCFAATVVEDPDGICDDGSGNRVAGSIVNEMGLGLPSFEVSLYGADLMRETSQIGRYVFPSMPSGGSYEISPLKDGDDRNGVNTLDLVRIQRHLLGLEYLDSPYKMIAADINNDERITGGDLLSLRKLLLGLDSEFLDNTSWKAVDAEYEFPDPSDPWIEEIPLTYYIPSLESNMNVDFVGVKIGDVDNSHNLTDYTEIESRSTKRTTIVLENAVDDNTIKVIANKSDLIYGMQMKFVVNGIELIDVKSGIVESQNIELSYGKGGYSILVSIPEGQEMSEEDVLFELEVEGEILNISKAIILSTDKSMTAEMYVGTEMEVSPIEIDYRGEFIPVSNLTVTQNRPNPWSDMTSITVQIPVADLITLSIYDINGKLLKSSTKRYEAGEHILQIDNQDLPLDGIYYYQIDYRTDTKQYKMIKIN